MCNCRNECAYLAVIISIISGVILGTLFALGFISTGLIFWVYLLIGVLGILLTPIYGKKSGGCTESCFCRYRQLITLAGAGAIVFAVVGLVVEFIASITVLAIIIGLATFFAVFLLSTVACLAQCICND